MMAGATAESPFTVLPKELMIDILSRDDLNNTLQLRCVCKSWKSLVVDSEFMMKHHYRLLTEISVLYAKARELTWQRVEYGEEEEKRVTLNDSAQMDNLNEDYERIQLVMNELVKLEIQLAKVARIDLEDRMKYIRSFMRIYLKSFYAGLK